uniref:Uncharacterized protein n=1 Tax=Oryza rufipogon TaxID=4529 RepID=A0A0E0NN18_ORYRU
MGRAFIAIQFGTITNRPMTWLSQHPSGPFIVGPARFIDYLDGNTGGLKEPRLLARLSLRQRTMNVERVEVDGPEGGEAGGEAEVAELLLGSLPALSPVGGHDEDVVLQQRPRPRAAVRRGDAGVGAGEGLGAGGVEDGLVEEGPGADERILVVLQNDAPEPEGLPPPPGTRVRPTAVSEKRRGEGEDDPVCSEKTPREARRRRRRSRTEGSGWPAGRRSAAASGALAPPAQSLAGTPRRMTAVSAMGTEIMLASSIIASLASAGDSSPSPPPPIFQTLTHSDIHKKKTREDRQKWKKKKNEEAAAELLFPLFPEQSFVQQNFAFSISFIPFPTVFPQLYITEYARTTSAIGARHSGHLPPLRISSFAHFEQVHMCPHLSPSPNGFYKYIRQKRLEISNIKVSDMFSCEADLYNRESICASQHTQQVPFLT